MSDKLRATLPLVALSALIPKATEWPPVGSASLV
jgi:hypothetical protein